MYFSDGRISRNTDIFQMAGLAGTHIFFQMVGLAGTHIFFQISFS
jgi:hypothetical protein